MILRTASSSDCTAGFLFSRRKSAYCFQALCRVSASNGRLQPASSFCRLEAICCLILDKDPDDPASPVVTFSAATPSSTISFAPPLPGFFPAHGNLPPPVSSPSRCFAVVLTGKIDGILRKNTGLSESGCFFLEPDSPLLTCKAWAR